MKQTYQPTTQKTNLPRNRLIYLPTRNRQIVIEKHIEIKKIFQGHKYIQNKKLHILYHSVITSSIDIFILHTLCMLIFTAIHIHNIVLYHCPR